LLGVLWEWRQARTERRLAQEGEYAADILLAQQALLENNRALTLGLLRKHRATAQACSPQGDPLHPQGSAHAHQAVAV
jgi:hypothetical protein